MSMAAIYKMAADDTTELNVHSSWCSKTSKYGLTSRKFCLIWVKFGIDVLLGIPHRGYSRFFEIPLCFTLGGKTSQIPHFSNVDGLLWNLVYMLLSTLPSKLFCYFSELRRLSLPEGVVSPPHPSPKFVSVTNIDWSSWNLPCIHHTTLQMEPQCPFSWFILPSPLPVGLPFRTPLPPDYPKSK